MLRLARAIALVLATAEAEAACRQIKAESDILGIRISDEASSERVLGKGEDMRSEQDKTAEGDDTDFPFVRIRSADGRQEAKLFEHYGGTAGAYAEIEVRPAHRAKTAAKRMSVPGSAQSAG